MLVVTILPLVKPPYAWNHFDLLWKMRVKVGHSSDNASNSKNIEYQIFKLQTSMTPGNREVSCTCSSCR